MDNLQNYEKTDYAYLQEIEGKLFKIAIESADFKLKEVHAGKVIVCEVKDGIESNHEVFLTSKVRFCFEMKLWKIW